MRVCVTEWHIKTGSRTFYTTCPVANAITPLLPAGQVAHVYHDAVVVKDGNLKTVSRGEFPQDVTARIERFDCGDKLVPFEFDLELEKA